MTRRSLNGSVYFLAYLACLPLANCVMGSWGTVCLTGGTCLIPVAPDLLTPSGTLVPGLALVLRDLVQIHLGRTWALTAIVLGTELAWVLAPMDVIVPSAAAFLVSEMADLAVFDLLKRQTTPVRVAASNLVGLVVDSAVFVALAFGDFGFLTGHTLSG